MLGASRSPTNDSSSPPERKLSSPEVTTEGQHPIACITCSTRKVKCDRQDPSCSNCLRSNIQCEYRAPLPRGPRKRKYPPEDDLNARLERYEELLKALGVSDPANATLSDHLPIRKDKPPARGFRAVPLPDGKVVLSESGRPRYIENKLWDSVAEEIPHDQDGEEYSSPPEDWATPGSIPTSNSGNGNGEAALLLGGYDLSVPGQPQVDVKALYPTRDQILGTWEIFLANVHPLTKIIHPPTFRITLENAMVNPALTSRKIDALVFAVCFVAVNTATDDEVERLFFGSKDIVLSQLQDSTAKALVAADVLRSDDLEVLQAMTFFLLCMRDRLDLRTMWMLTGTAMRIAMGMGMHRGGGFEHYFSPFELEFRRRTWWQVATLDMRTGELAGFGASTAVIESDANSPGNFNDADLHPDMKEFPPERSGASEMLFITTRSSFREYGSKMQMGPLFVGVSKFDMPLAEREKKIMGMEQMFEQNVLRYCDPLEPLHILISAMCRTVVHRLRLKAYHPLFNIDGDSFGKAQTDVCYNSALKMIEYDNYVYGTTSARGFVWHLRAHYQWDALIYVLSELKRRGDDDDTRKAWKQVEQSFNHHPEFIHETRKPLHLAVSNLCLKAYAAREASQAASSPTRQPPPPPKFIEALREKHAKSKSPTPIIIDGLPGPNPPPINQPDFADFANASLDPSFFGDGFGMGNMDWSLWNETALQYNDTNLFRR